MPLDHLVWATPDLDAAVAEFEALTGAAPSPGGVHDGRGTRNALVALDGHRYLEIIAPDPDQTLKGSSGEALLSLRAPFLKAYCWAEPNLESVQEKAAALKLRTSGPQNFQRTRPDGLTLCWRLLFIEDSPLGSVIPFFIDWQDAPHPSQNCAASLTLERLCCETTDPHRLDTILGALGVDIRIAGGRRNKLTATLSGPKGNAVFHS